MAIISDEDKALLRSLLEARQAEEDLKAAYDRAKAARSEVELDVYDRFEDVEGQIKVDLGEPWGVVAFRTRTTAYAKIVDPDALQKHYEDRAMIDEVSAPRFVKARLNEEVREALDAGQLPPPGLDYYFDRGMTITRQKK